jgi:hypothetical protein
MRLLLTASVLAVSLGEVGVHPRADAAPVPFPNPLGQQLAGTWFRGTRYHNVTIHLQANGGYTARLYVCVAGAFPAGSSEGRWRVSGSVIVLEPLAQRRPIPKIPQRLHLVRHNGAFVLVADLEDKDYRKLGVTPLTAFQKQPAEKVD